MNHLAQLTTTVELNTASALVVYGPMGAMLLWFMVRFESMVKAFGILSHRIDGVTRAMLLDVASRDSAGPQVKRIAQEMLAKIEARDTKD